MLSQRKISQLLKGYIVVFHEYDKQFKLLKDGIVVDRVSSFCIHSTVQAKYIFAERLLK